MLPHLGAGAGQCIEDAYVIAQLLGHPGTTSSNLEVGQRWHWCTHGGVLMRLIW